MSKTIDIAHMIHKNIIVIIACSIGILAILSVARFMKGANYWLLDLCSHFPVQYGIIALGLLGMCMWKRIFFFGSLAALLAIVNLSVFAEYRAHTSPLHPLKQVFTVYLANMWRMNPALSNIHQEILRINADCVFLMEVTPHHIDPLQPLIQRFPYRIEQPMNDFTGFVLLSHYPIEDYQVITRQEHGNRPLLSAEIHVAQTHITFYGIHPHTPVWRQKFHQRNTQLMWLANHIADMSHPVIVAGDLNTTPFAPIFHKFLTRAGLKDTRHGVGWYPSWPVYMPLFWLPIDHILVSSDVHVSRLSTGACIGSDHYPIIAEIGI